MLVHLLDYLAKDYSGAIQNGQVISESEYHEQIEFSHIALDASQAAPELKSHPAILAGVASLSRLIAEKKGAEEVSRLARKLQAEVLAASPIALAPARWPSLARGRALFTQNCASCHGAEGRGDGPAAAALKPKPANFRDDETMRALSPFQAFNTIRIGVPGTAMAPFSALGDVDTWALAFYAVSLRHAEEASASVSAKASPSPQLLAQVSSRSDDELRKDHDAATLARLRLISGPDDPAAGSSGGKSTTGASAANPHPPTTLALANQLLDEAAGKAAAGLFDEALETALRAYLEGVEPVEPRLRSRSQTLVTEVETRMSEVRAALRAHAAGDLLAGRIAAAHAVLGRAESALTDDVASSSRFVLFSVIAIFLREGFEALLIVLAMLSVIRATGATRAARWVHAGWIAALVSGVGAWIASGWLMAITGAQRELMEGLISLFAVVVLVYMGFWLHSQTEIGRWRQFIDVKIKAALNGRNRIGLSAIAFFAVFREVFETVLFLRAIWLEGGNDSSPTILTGVVIALVLVIGMGWLLLRTSARLPIRKIFAVSSGLMVVLAFILTGKGFHSLQEAGWVGETFWLRWLRFDFFGLYPTAETLAPQAALLALSLVLWKLGKRPARRRPARAVPQNG